MLDVAAMEALGNSRPSSGSSDSRTVRRELMRTDSVGRVADNTVNRRSVNLYLTSEAA